MVEPGAVSVANARLDAPELRDLVVDVTRTIGLLIRPFGILWPPATNEEAQAIAAPAARMLQRAPMVQRIVRKIADPVVLTGAVVALVGPGRGRFAATGHVAQQPTPAPAPGAQPASVGAPGAGSPVAASGAAAPSASVGAMDFNAAAALREQILNGIAHADLR